MSWNTYLGRGNLSELVARLERGEFTGNVPVARFALLLQEVYRTSILAFARERGLYAVYAPARLRQGDADDRGAAILATSPIAAIAIVELPFEKQRRIALGARVDGIELVNVHFDTAVGILRGGPGPTRRRQARAVIDAVSDMPAPLVLGGDLNTWWGDDEPAVEELRRAFPDATAAAARETWRGPLWMGNKLDYVFAKGFEPAITIRRLDSRYGSDHWPLMTIVPIEENRDSRPARPTSGRYLRRLGHQRDDRVPVEREVLLERLLHDRRRHRVDALDAREDLAGIAAEHVHGLQPAQPVVVLPQCRLVAAPRRFLGAVDVRSSRRSLLLQPLDLLHARGRSSP